MLSVAIKICKEVCIKRGIQSDPFIHNDIDHDSLTEFDTDLLGGERGRQVYPRGGP